MFYCHKNSYRTKDAGPNVGQSANKQDCWLAQIPNACRHAILEKIRKQHHKNLYSLNFDFRTRIENGSEQTTLKFGPKLSFLLKILGLALGSITIIFGVNEATSDILDKIGSNYWLAYSAVASGTVIIILVLILSKRYRHAP